MLDCPDCRATGQRRVYDAKAPTNLPDLATCPTCAGTGQLPDEPAAPARGRRGASTAEPDPPDGDAPPPAQG
ncbi:MAG TPA: hypothetical protein VK066_20670 [Chloroflexota bacterium]|nr:hypothetical protein [Chloroflexota bacterium]